MSRRRRAGRGMARVVADERATGCKTVQYVDILRKDGLWLTCFSVHGLCDRRWALGSEFEAGAEGKAVAAESVDVGDILDERYELVEVVGRGGCGVVFRATDLNLLRDVAVKVLSWEGGGHPEMLERFEREGQILRRLHAPNTVFFYDSGYTPQHLPYIVMEFVAGRQLKERIESEGRLEPGEAVAILTQVFQALVEAHEYGFIHRDLKPGNIMLCERPGFPGAFVKVLDFGIAKIASEEDSCGSVEMAGTPKYMAPEQFKNEAVTAQADLYSMGCIAYEMLTGVAPIDGDTLHVTVAKHLFMVPRSMDASLDVYPNLEAVVFKLLEKDPAARFSSAQAVLDALEHWREPELIESLRGCRTHGEDEGGRSLFGEEAGDSAQIPQAYADALNRVPLKGCYAIRGVYARSETEEPLVSPLELAAAEHQEMMKSRYGAECVKARRHAHLKYILAGVFLAVVLGGVFFFVWKGSSSSSSTDLGVLVLPESEPSRGVSGDPVQVAERVSEYLVCGFLDGGVLGGFAVEDLAFLLDEGAFERFDRSRSLDTDGGKPSSRRSKPRRGESSKDAEYPIFQFELRYKPVDAQVGFLNALGQCRDGVCVVKTTSSKVPARIVVSSPGYVTESRLVSRRIKEIRIQLKPER